MPEKKLPPPEKIVEAWTAIVSDRVTLKGNGDEGSATIASSDASKTYAVSWKGDVYASNDSATWWQNYPGYPVLAVLMLQGALPFNESLASHFKNINWKKLNTEARGDYAEALFKAMNEMDLNDGIAGEVEKAIQETLAVLADLPIVLKRSRKKLA